MTVNDLIKQLQAMSDEDRERVVVVTCESGGDIPIYTNMITDVHCYAADSTGTFGLNDDAVRVMVLAPVN